MTATMSIKIRSSINGDHTAGWTGTTRVYRNGTLYSKGMVSHSRDYDKVLADLRAFAAQLTDDLGEAATVTAMPIKEPRFI